MNGKGWSPAEVRRVGAKVVDLIAGYLERLGDGPVWKPVPRALIEAWQHAAPPLVGQSSDEILEAFARDIAPYPFGNGHPRFFGWVNSPPTEIGIFADALAAAMNPSVAGGDHAAVYVERQVVRWFAEMLGFRADAMGLLVSGSSAAALTGLAVARLHACRRIGRDVREDGLQGVSLRVYATAEAHSCHQKAVELLGLGRKAMRLVPSDAVLRLDTDRLDALIREDIAAGHQPMAVIASAGTVNTGAIDPIDRIADICARHGVWLHVDGAYGAPAVLTERYGDALQHINRADSLAMDPHKWLSVPVENGLILVRDAQLMRDTFSLVPAYLRTDDEPWLSEYGIQQTRGFRALKTWMALRYHGVDGYKQRITNDCMLAERFADQIRRRADLELWSPSSLSIVCFRLRDSDDRNRDLLKSIQHGGRAFLSGTVIDGRFWLRCCFVNHLTTDADIEILMRAI
ncbi:MAG TPA: pyridoxal-dependent decarboxylase [Gemmatimonadaceae bacterium]|nr:pyridoxal-dependent decarboxylase [Gemmatimonadaceae bacterium]